MIETKDKKTRTEKFFFDQNCFDEDYEEEIVEEEPPPPVFSEEELARAKADGYEQGKKDGLAEAEASREKHVTAILETISNNLQTIFNAEQTREAQYEGEVVALAHTIFAKLFPALNEQQGLAEIEAVIRNVLDSQKTRSKITLEVPEDYAGAIEERLNTIVSALPADTSITVKGKENFGPGDCRMSWDDGGAERNLTGLAEEIHRQLEHILADKPTLQDNREEEPKPSQQDAAEPTEQITERTDDE